MRAQLLQCETDLRGDFFRRMTCVRLNDCLDFVNMLDDGGLKTLKLRLSKARVVTAAVDRSG